jgi:hypothetical protein
MRELGIAIVVAALVIGFLGRYTVSSGGSGSAIVVDGLTGQAWFCSVASPECIKLD